MSITKLHYCLNQSTLNAFGKLKTQVENSHIDFVRIGIEIASVKLTITIKVTTNLLKINEMLKSYEKPEVFRLRLVVFIYLGGL